MRANALAFEDAGRGSYVLWHGYMVQQKAWDCAMLACLPRQVDA